MDYRLNLGSWRKVFAVPSCVAEDHHLKLASGSQIKVLLYLLAYPDISIREDNIASELGISKEDVSDALLYWVNAKILTNSGGEYYPSDEARRVHEKQASPEQPDSISRFSTPEARAALSSETHYPPRIIADTVNKDEGVRYLFDTYERLSGKPVNHASQETLMILVEEIGLPCEVTTMLVEFCFHIGKGTPAYMKAVARDWIDKGITDILKAEEQIRLLQERHDTENKLRIKFGIRTAFSTKQKQYIDEWTASGIPEELIDEAYDRMLTNTGKLSFSYMDKILKSWSAEGITSAEALKKEKNAPRAAAKAPPSYDKTEIDQRTLNKYKNLS